MQQTPQDHRKRATKALHSVCVIRRGLPGELPLAGVTVGAMTYPLTAAQANLAKLVAEARRSHRPVTISEHGRQRLAAF